MNNCKNCEHSIFNEQWGEYKCKERSCSIPILLSEWECKFYKKKKKKDKEDAK